MTKESEKLKKSSRTHTENLTRLGKEMAKNQFSYKIIENTSQQYWENRIIEFKKYNEKTIEYYTHAHALINLVDKEQSGLFLLSISKLHHLGLELKSVMEEIKQNPSTVKSKDKQQSKWSKELREKLIETTNTCLHHEKYMNKFFREFYENRLKNILE